MVVERNTLGSTGLRVPGLCVGTGPLGSVPGQYGYEVSTEQAVVTLVTALGGSGLLGHLEQLRRGASERRIGETLRRVGGLPAGAVLATKVDPAPGSRDFSGARVRESVRESLQRLGVARLQLVYLHDPERITYEEATAPDGPIPALVELRDQGVIDHLGVAGGPVDLMRRYLDIGVFEVLLSHNRFTLVDSTAGPLFDHAAAAGVGVVNGAPYGGGMLVKGPQLQPMYCYRPVGAATLDRVRRMQRACARYDIALAAAALQYSTRDRRITSTVVGISDPSRVAQTVALAATTLPVDLWAELDALAAVHDTHLDDDR